MNYGTLYGIGAGPGDPELLTLKAVRILGQVDRIYAARSSKNAHSSSHAIAEPHLKDGVEVSLLPFPMTRDKEALTRAWEDNARTILTDLRQGLNVAFLTLGDPMTYSTFGYLKKTLATIDPNAPVEIVPGVTAFAASAAASGFVLAEEEEHLAVVSGAKGGDHVKKAAEYADSLVVLKAYKQFEEIRSALDQTGFSRDAIVVENCGHPQQRISRDMTEITERPGYFTLILSRKAQGT